MEIEIPITPMLDMAFQLLTFFILTYKPAPIEGQFSMNLLPAQAATEISKEQPKEEATPSLDAELRTLKTVLRAGELGQLGEVTLADNPVADLVELKKELEVFVNDPNVVFDQALIRVDPQLKYSELVKVIDVFASLKPKPLTKISFAELDPSGGEEPPQ
ncbi:ExbD/TolR family protein [Tundrisphaera lichenicola]|uniref:ExbD/TolR family protein n=1 Tax=Tundrisphaera lichenicola TaxID=2029860 RepID=UPI003EBBA073